MRLVKGVLGLILIVILTALTQIGGLVLLISLLPHKFINNKLGGRWVRILVKFLLFLIIYLFSVFVLVPLVANPFGRVQLPLLRTRNLQPGTVWTFLLNRNYVRPQLRETIFEVAERMNKDYPGTVINYLDANFPFIDKFPMFPHLSHNDGKKLDVSFNYMDRETGKQTNDIPSFVGYGICEAPKPNEENMPALCDKQGYWQYSLLRKLVSQDNKKKFEFDSYRTSTLVNLFAEQEGIERIFIEPHLKTRLGLTNSKIRFHGCHAVRHDDHLHVQIK